MDKLEKYFRDMVLKLYSEWFNSNRRFEIVREIYLSGRRYQAERDRGAIEKLAEQCGCNEVPTADEIFEALKAAGIKEIR